MLIYLSGCSEVLGLSFGTGDLESLLQHAGSVLCCARGLSGCGVCASAVVACGVSCSAACGILVSRPEIEPKSPALQGGVPGLENAMDRGA